MAAIDRKTNLFNLLLGLVVVGLLSGLLLAFAIRRALAPSPTWRALGAVHTIHKALDLYHQDTGMYPTSQLGVAALRSPYPRGPYIVEDLAVDPWERPYVYTFDADGTPTVSTLGADGKPGGTGPDVDIVIRHSQAVK